jgi:hypothetical protein
MGTREPLKGGDEFDRLHWKGWRRALSFRPGESAAIKAKFWRRVRRMVRASMKTETAE